jgi:mRNA interferase RelE/StbE
MEYQIEIKLSARKAILALSKDLQQRMYDAINKLAEQPRPSGVVKLFGEHDLYRVRIGEYRILYEIHDNRVF